MQAEESQADTLTTATPQKKGELGVTLEYHPKPPLVRPTSRVDAVDAAAAGAKHGGCGAGEGRGGGGRGRRPEEGRGRAGGGEGAQIPGYRHILGNFRDSQTRTGHPHAAQGTAQHDGCLWEGLTRGKDKYPTDEYNDTCPARPCDPPCCRRRAASFADAKISYSSNQVFPFQTHEDYKKRTL